MRFTPAFMILEEFDSTAESGKSVGWGIDLVPPKAAAKEVKLLTEQDLKQAYDDGYESGYQTATAEFEVILDQRDGEARAVLAAAEQKFAEDCGTKLAEDLSLAIGEIRKELADEAARSILPLIDSRLRAIAIEDLAECIKEIEAGADGGELRVKGPSALISALEQKLSESWRVLATVDEDATELVAQVDTGLFRTQIESWVKRVKEASK